MFVTLLIFFALALRVAWPLEDVDDVRFHALLDRLERAVERLEEGYVRDGVLDNDLFDVPWEKNAIFLWDVEEEEDPLPSV